MDVDDRWPECGVVLFSLLAIDIEPQAYALNLPEYHPLGHLDLEHLRDLERESRTPEDLTGLELFPLLVGQAGAEGLRFIADRLAVQQWVGAVHADQIARQYRPACHMQPEREDTCGVGQRSHLEAQRRDQQPAHQELGQEQHQHHGREREGGAQEPAAQPGNGNLQGRAEQQKPEREIDVCEDHGGLRLPWVEVITEALESILPA